jgi:hypothetical protein
MSGNVSNAVHSVAYPKDAPATEYVEMPDGSSSAAPVTSPDRVQPKIVAGRFVPLDGSGVNDGIAAYRAPRPQRLCLYSFLYELVESHHPSLVGEIRYPARPLQLSRKSLSATTGVTTLTRNFCRSLNAFTMRATERLSIRRDTATRWIGTLLRI